VFSLIVVDIFQQTIYKVDDSATLVGIFKALLWTEQAIQLVIGPYFYLSKRAPAFPNYNCLSIFRKLSYGQLWLIDSFLPILLMLFGLIFTLLNHFFRVWKFRKGPNEIELNNNNEIEIENDENKILINENEEEENMPFEDEYEDDEVVSVQKKKIGWKNMPRSNYE
jgi:hypothetical protein